MRPEASSSTTLDLPWLLYWIAYQMKCSKLSSQIYQSKISVPCAKQAGWSVKIRGVSSENTSQAPRSSSSETTSQHSLRYQSTQNFVQQLKLWRFCSSTLG